MLILVAPVSFKMIGKGLPVSSKTVTSITCDCNKWIWNTESSVAPIVIIPPKGVIVSWAGLVTTALSSKTLNKNDIAVGYSVNNFPWSKFNFNLCLRVAWFVGTPAISTLLKLGTSLVKS